MGRRYWSLHIMPKRNRKTSRWSLHSRWKNLYWKTIRQCTSSMRWCWSSLWIIREVRWKMYQVRLGIWLQCCPVKVHQDCLPCQICAQWFRKMRKSQRPLRSIRRPRSMLSLHPNSLSSRKWSLPSNWKAKPMPTQKILGWRQFLPWSERILWNFQQRDWNLHRMHF